MEPRFPSRFALDPLLDVVGGNKSMLARIIGRDRRIVIAWSVNGIPWRAADDAACALGMHPSEVWPDFCQPVEAVA